MVNSYPTADGLKSDLAYVGESNSKICSNPW